MNTQRCFFTLCKTSSNKGVVWGRSWVREYRPRKPLWKGRAASKIEQLRLPRPISKEERDELTRLHRDYKTRMRSFVEFCRKEYFDAKTISAVKFNESDESFRALLEENDRENAKTAEIREAAMKVVSENAVASLQEKYLRIMELNEQKKEKAEEKIKELKIMSKEYIKPDQIDEVIERALANPVDYNFYVTPDKKIVYGSQPL